MSTSKILSDLMSGQSINTLPHTQSRYGVNQIPDSIRKIRRKYGSESVNTVLKPIVKNGIGTRVAIYYMPADQRKRINKP